MSLTVHGLNDTSSLNMFTTQGLTDGAGGIPSTDHMIHQTTKGGNGAAGETTSSTFLYTTLAPPPNFESGGWTVQELTLLGGVLWLVMLITLVGNLACFYAVIRNMKVIFSLFFFVSS